MSAGVRGVFPFRPLQEIGRGLTKARNGLAFRDAHFALGKSRPKRAFNVPSRALISNAATTAIAPPLKPELIPVELSPLEH
jgi:hypothetical protein